MSRAAANAALRQAVAKYAGYISTPVIVDGIKHEFIRIMHADFGIDLREHLLDIEIEFDRRGAPWLTIDPDLLATTLH
jgi:hypothetical protein